MLVLKVFYVPLFRNRYINSFSYKEDWGKSGSLQGLGWDGVWLYSAIKVLKPAVN